MKAGLFSQLFPPPKYLALPAAGFDLSDRSLKFVSFERDGKSLRLAHFGEKEIPLDVLQSGQIRDQAALVEILKKAKSEWNLEQVVMALPEERAYVVRVNLPNVPASEERESIELQLEENIPLPPGEMIFDYERLPNKHASAIVSAFPRQFVAEYEEVLAKAGLQPLAFEVEAQAVARAVVPANHPETVLVIDFGKTRTSFFMVRAGQVLFTSTSAQLGGDIMTRAIEKNLNLNTIQAETLKLKQGLLAGPEQEKLAMALVPALSVLRDEVSKLESYWERHLANSGAGEGKISQIMLCGGEAILPGLVDYLTGQISLPVTLANVWVNVIDTREKAPELNFHQSLRYATAIGLALRRT